jgi:hypothetical protein
MKKVVIDAKRRHPEEEAWRTIYQHVCVIGGSVVVLAITAAGVHRAVCATKEWTQRVHVPTTTSVLGR